MQFHQELTQQATNVKLAHLTKDVIGPADDVLGSSTLSVRQLTRGSRQKVPEMESSSPIVHNPHRMVL